MSTRLISIFVACCLVACTQSSKIVTGTVRSEIDPESVKVYSDPPPNYETVAVIESWSGLGITQQQDTDLALEAAKKEAAKLGANGVLLTGLKNKVGSSSGTGLFTGSNGNTGIVSVSGGYANQSEIKATAIFVSPIAESDDGN